MRILKLLSLLCICGIVGCHAVRYFEPEWPPYDKEIMAVYEQIEPGESSSADVLTSIKVSGDEILSQSESVVAALGEKKRGMKAWLIMAAFEEEELTVRRKYLLIEDEKPKSLFVEPWESLKFDCEVILSREVLGEPYSNENERRIAIIKAVLENARADIKGIAEDYKMIDTCGMLINQAFETVVVKLESSPAFAARLSEEHGLEFRHLSYDKGRIRMIVEDDIATIRLRLGSAAKKWIGRDL